MKYRINNENRSETVVSSVEPDLLHFILDYAQDLGVTRSNAVRRLILIGARCEAEHGGARMPISFKSLGVDDDYFEEDFFGDIGTKKKKKIKDWLVDLDDDY